MTKAVRREIRAMVKSGDLRREAARLAAPHIGRGARNITLDGYLSWLTAMGRAFPPARRNLHRPERFTLP